MQVEDRITIEKVNNGYQVLHASKKEGEDYRYTNNDYVFVTFDEVVAWVKAQA